MKTEIAWGDKAPGGKFGPGDYTLRKLEGGVVVRAESFAKKS